MSSVSIASLQRVTASELSKMLLDDENASKRKVAVVDVRDDDYIGGHIKGCHHVPSQHFDSQVSSLIRNLADHEVVVFHCALSQQRGPRAALKYLRELEKHGPSSSASKASEDASAPTKTEKTESSSKQNVLVLEGGFTTWQAVFGDDKRLTEGYRKDLWGLWDE